jgi:drug/metabolite transporter (DMT)-like permease
MLTGVRRLPAEVLLLGTVVLWSFNFTAVRYGVTHGVEPLVYVSLRWLIAGVALWAIVRLRGRSLRLGRRDLPVIAFASVVGVVINQVAFSYSLHLTAASTVALVFGTLPIFVSLLSHLAGHERLGRRHWLATAVSFSGVALVAAGTSGGVRASVGGILLALVTTLSFAAYSVAIVPAMRRHSPLTVNAASCLIGGLLLCLISLPWFARQAWSAPPSLAWTALLYSGLGSIVIGNVFWFTAIDRVGAGRSALYANLQPFLGALFAVLVLSEHLHPIQIVGGLVIASGIALGGRIRLSAPPTD